MTHRSPSYQRGLVLLEQGRDADAEREFRATLANDPGDASAHAMLSIVLTRLDKPADATDEARLAIAADPQSSTAHYALALAMAHRNRDAEAMAAIDEAIGLDLANPSYYDVKAQLYLRQEAWRSALQAADWGLEIDPQHPGCVNARAAALVHLGRRDEAAATMQDALADDPENAWTHANHGWSLLHRNRPREAMEAFAEALRLDPTIEWAKAGIVEAIKARNPVYRLLLAFFLWLGRLGTRAAFAIVVGGWVGVQAIGGVGRANPALLPYTTAITFAYFGFVLLTWLAPPLFDLLLRLHPLGRHALSAAQRRTSEFVGVALLAVIGMVVAAMTVGPAGTWVVAALVTTLTLLPASKAAFVEAGWPRAALGLILVVVVGLGAWAIWSEHRGVDAGAALSRFALAAVASQLATPMLVMARPRR